jgi:Transglutaminase-like superfamily
MTSSEHPSGDTPDAINIGPWWLSPWADTVATGGPDIDLTRAALYLSAHGCTQLRSMHDVGLALEKIDRLAEVATIPHAGNTSFEAWHRLCFTTLGLHGDNANYHDPRNSYLPDVMSRRVGLPIALAVLCIEFGQRLGVDCWGVGMPGHFLIGARREIGGQAVFIDAFDGGTILDVDGCHDRFVQMFGTDREWSTALLDATDERSMLIRMIANLKQHAARRRDLITLSDLARLRWFLPHLALDEGRELVRLCAALGALDEAPIWMARLVTRFGAYEGFAVDQRILQAALT